MVEKKEENFKKYKTRSKRILNLDLGKIKRLYVDEKKSVNEIRKIMDVSYKPINKRLKEMNIKIRTGKECKTGRKKIILDINKIKELYVNQKKSSVEIGKIFSVCHKTIIKRLKEMDVRLRDKGEFMKEWNRMNENPMKNQEIREKARKSIIEGFKNGRKVWAEGLTKETSEILKKSGERSSKTKKRLFKEKKIKIPLMAFKKGDQRISGKNNPKWNNGSSFEPYDKNFNKKFKRLIRKRDNYICLKCGKHQEKENRTLTIHHIDYNKKLTIKENCCTLCNKCNIEVNKNRKHWIKFFQSLLKERYGYQYSEMGEIIVEVQDGRS